MTPLEQRKTSGFPLSISTGYAMETLFFPRSEVYDKERVAPSRVSLSDYNLLAVNILTLLRNILNATEFSDVRQIRPEALLNTLLFELEVIQSLCANEGRGLIQPYFYATDYSSFYRGKSPEYKLRVPTTDKQKSWFGLVEETLRRAFLSGNNFHKDFAPRSPSDRCVVLTHITPDLLNYRSFGNLELLESHTGKVKTRREWNSKYHPLGSDKLTNMPWCRPLLCYFGDKYVLSPLSITIRKTIIELAEDRRWNPMTSDSTVYLDCMNKIKNPDIVKVLRQISIN